MLKNRIKAIFCSLALVATVGCAAVDPYADLPKSVREARREISKRISSTYLTPNSSKVLNRIFCEEAKNKFFCRGMLIQNINDPGIITEKLLFEAGAKEASINGINMIYTEYDLQPTKHGLIMTAPLMQCLVFAKTENKTYLFRHVLEFDPNLNRPNEGCDDVAYQLSKISNYW